MKAILSILFSVLVFIGTLFGVVVPEPEFLSGPTAETTEEEVVEIEEETSVVLPVARPPEVADPGGESVITSGPLRANGEEEAAALTREGVILWTNAERLFRGELVLSENDALNAVAERKMNDMFLRQYFEHVSPTGDDVGDLARKEGYQFLLIGENLALGSFKSNQALVRAWMESPGHRANILNESYREIGVAVGEGEFEGRRVWLAVQTFGTPRSACPAVDANLRQEIEDESAELERLGGELNILRAEIEAYQPKRGPEYNTLVNEYNLLAAMFNSLLAEVEDLIGTYNREVNTYNVCVEEL